MTGEDKRAAGALFTAENAEGSQRTQRFTAPLRPLRLLRDLCGSKRARRLSGTCESSCQGNTASASISTRAFGSTSPVTPTSVIAGKCRPSVSPQAAPTSAPPALNSAMSVT